MPRYSRGVQSLQSEIDDTRLCLQGTLPDWLCGDLVRNGPALFEVGSEVFSHWFDGLSALHKFSFANGQVHYTCRFLQSQAYKRAKTSGRISSVEFGSRRQMNPLERMRNVVAPELSDNANVNVACLGDRWVALTETPHVTEFALSDLNTAGGYRFDDRLKFHVTTAHPHFDFSQGALYNVVVAFGKTSKYALTRQMAGEKKRTLMGRLESPNPGYMHSFAMTRRYVILSEFPLRLSALDLLFSGKPYIECYHWHKEKPTNFIVVDKENGSLVRRFEAEAGFSFHHINAYERGHELVLDLVYFPDAQIVRALYLNNLRQNGPVPVGQGRRFILDLTDGMVRSEMLADGGVEFPRINYTSCAAKEYTYFYGAGTDFQHATSAGLASSASRENVAGGDFLNDLRKIDIGSKEVTIWKEEDCYPGEPIFVGRPAGINSGREDDGVLLSIVLNAQKEESFLLVIDACSMQEVARLRLPQVAPFTFHGIFAGERQ